MDPYWEYKRYRYYLLTILSPFPSRLGFLSQWEALAERYGAICPPGWPWPNHHPISIDNQNNGKISYSYFNNDKYKNSHNCVFAENTSTNRSENNASPAISVSGNRSPTSHSTYLEHEEESDEDNPDMGDDDNASLDPSGGNDGSEKGIHGKRKKKTRTVFSRAQVFQLESTFDLKR